MIVRRMIPFFFGILFGLFFLSDGTAAFTKPSMIDRSAMSKPSVPCSFRMKIVTATGPAVIEKTETIEEIAEDEKVTEKDEQLGKDGWEIRLFNDPFNKREFVARCLSTVCGKSDTESYQIMMQAHNDGMGVVGRYMYEIAELYYKSLQDNGLMVDMVRVDDD